MGDDKNENINEELRDLQADIDDLSSIEENDEGGRRKRKRRTLGGVGTKEKKRKGKNEESNKKIEISGEFNDSMFDSSDEEGQLDNDSSDLESLTKGRGKSKKIKNGGRLRKGKVEKQKGR